MRMLLLPRNAAEPEAPSLLRIAFALSYDLIIGLVIFAVPSIVVPRELSLFTEDAAAILAAIQIVNAIAGVCAPIVGYSIDRLGSNAPHKILSAISMTAGGALATLAVHLRNDYSLAMYVTGVLMLTVPAVAVVGMCISGITAAFVAARPARASTISGMAAAYILVGSSVGIWVVGTYLPVGPKEHGFYYVLLGTLLVGNVLLALGDTAHKPVSTPLLHETQPATRHSVCGVLYEYVWGHDYRAFRLIVLAKVAFMAGQLLPSYDGLYIVEDLFGHHGADAQQVLARIGLASTAGGLIVAMPAGFIADRFGMVPCVVGSTVLLSGVLFATPFLPNATYAQALLPITGVAQQLYGVVDFALVVATLPDPTRRARDVGTFNAAGALGPLLVSAFNGAVLSAMGGAPPAGSGSKRPTYPREAYLMVYAPTAALVLVSSVLVCAASRLLRKDSNPTSTAASDARHDEDCAAEVRSSTVDM